MSEEVMKLIITPAMSSVSVPGIRRLKMRSSTMTTAAPMKAATTVSRKPLSVSSPAVNVPPSKSIAMATPNPAPLLTPRMLGSASGLAKMVCSSRPATARAAPAIAAVSKAGKRDCRTMKAVALVVSLPVRACHTSPAGRSMLPQKRLAVVSKRSRPTLAAFQRVRILRAWESLCGDVLSVVRVGWSGIKV